MRWKKLSASFIILGAAVTSLIVYTVFLHEENMGVEQEQATAWVLLIYKIPREPTSSRAMIWRKLKRLGALLLHDAAWVLPATAWTREQFQWLSVEIGELGGEAYRWESRLLVNEQWEHTPGST